MRLQNLHEVIMRLGYPSMVAFGLFIFLQLETTPVDACRLKETSKCDHDYRTDAAKFKQITQNKGYSLTETYQMICKIQVTYANCSYPLLDGCYQYTIDEVDAFFAKYSTCKIKNAAERGLKIVPNPTVPLDRINGTCDLKAVDTCTPANHAKLRDIVNGFRTGVYNVTTQRTLLCQEGERFAVCMYSMTIGCSSPYLKSVDDLINKYNIKPFSCDLPLYVGRNLSGRPYINGRFTTSASVTGDESTKSTKNLLTLTTSTQRPPTSFNAATTSAVTGGSSVRCKLDDLLVCDKNFENDTENFQNITKQNKFTIVQRAKMFCRIVFVYANCTYPKLHGCYQKTVDYIDNFYATYKPCKVAKAARRGIVSIPNPTVPPERKNGSCNTTDVNSCITDFRDVIDKMSIKFDSGNYTADIQRKIICNATMLFSVCIYSKSMGCTNDYLDKVDAVLRKYNKSPFHCGLPYYKQRNLNGTSKHNVSQRRTMILSSGTPTSRSTSTMRATSRSTQTTKKIVWSLTSKPTIKKTTKPTTKLTTKKITKLTTKKTTQLTTKTTKQTVKTTKKQTTELRSRKPTIPATTSLNKSSTTVLTTIPATTSLNKSSTTILKPISTTTKSSTKRTTDQSTNQTTNLKMFQPTKNSNRQSSSVSTTKSKTTEETLNTPETTASKPSPEEVAESATKTTSTGNSVMTSSLAILACIILTIASQHVGLS